LAEEMICAQLRLKPAAIASQVISRDRHAAWVSALALVSATLEKIALEVRHLQRTEVGEAEEPFSEGQKGSSAMPHKRNPVVSEQICGLARVVRANVQPALEDIALWHERDISHSSVERVILADSAILTDYLLHKTQWLVNGMRVYPERMMTNLRSTHGLIFSGQLLLELAEAGMLREEAYRVVQDHAMKAWASGGDFEASVESDSKILSFLSIEKIRDAFSLPRHLAHVDRIFARVFQKSQSAQQHSGY
jgi:adenylosuccinate lyase